MYLAIYIANTFCIFLSKQCDTQILLLKNQVAALRKGVFAVIKDIMGIQMLENLPGYGVCLESVVVWYIRDMRLHGHVPSELTFNMKLDGRPFYGKSPNK